MSTKQINGTVWVLGDGAIGSLAAANLLQQYVDVHLRTRQPRDWQTVVTLDNNQNVPLPISDNTVKPTSNDVLLVPLKSYQIASALSELADWLVPNMPIVLLNNGMGVDEQLSTTLHTHPLYLGITSHAALRQAANKDGLRCVVHTGMGSTLVGTAGTDFTRNAELDSKIVAILDCALGPAQWCDDIQQAQWQKLAINAVINPLTALNDCRNGALLNEQYQAIITALCAETSAVMQALGFSASTEALISRVTDVCQNTAQNYSSMHQDHQHQRPLELDSITGYLIDKAQKKGVPVPQHTLIYRQLSEL